MYLYGDYNTRKARLISIQLIKCTGHTYCKTDEEILEFLRDKWIMLLVNQIRFDSEGFDEATSNPEARVKWIPINTQY